MHDGALTSAFGAVVRMFRKRLGLTQEELAWRAGMHRTYLADIERGGRNISLSRIVRLVAALEVSLPRFFLAVQEELRARSDTNNGKLPERPARRRQRTR